MKHSIIVALVFLFFGIFQGQAQIEEAKLDELVKGTLKAFDVPGISVGIIKDGKVVYSKWHGVRSLKNKKDMNAETLVGVASNSKGFTCFALALLVDEGKLKWEDKVRKYIPEFKLASNYATEEFTIRDLVTHRSGMGLGAGDLMFFPEGNDFTIDDVIAGVQHLKPENSFRSTFRYNNNMYNIAGEVIKRVSGLSWEEFIEQRIMQPVGMNNSKASYNRVTDHSNIIDAHLRTEGKVKMVPHDWSETANPAGGIISNVPDMMTWAKFLINGGVTDSGKRLISEEQMHLLWQLQTPIPVGKNHPYNSHFLGYAHGWFVSDVKGGYKEVTHTGGLLGTVTQFTMIPELGLGIVVLTNQMSGSAFRTITHTIKDAYLGYEDRNWLEKLSAGSKNFLAKTDKQKADVYAKVAKMKRSKNKLSEDKIIGTYTDPWFGDVEISKGRGGCKIHCVRSPRLTGKLLPYSETTFVAKWDNRSYDADVFVIFSLDENGKAVSAKMHAISDITDFSFDFQNLDLKRTK